MNEATIDLARRDVRATVSDDDIRRNQRVDRAISGDGDVIERQRYGAVWNDNKPLLIGDFHLWRSTGDGKWRVKNGKAASDTDGDPLNPDVVFTSTWNGSSRLRLGTYTLWVDPGTGYLRIKNGTPTSATDGVAVGAGI